MKSENICNQTIPVFSEDRTEHRSVQLADIEMIAYGGDGLLSITWIENGDVLSGETDIHQLFIALGVFAPQVIERANRHDGEVLLRLPSPSGSVH